MADKLLPPHNIDAEQAALGSMMLDKDALLVGLERLTHKDFYRPVHGAVFDTLKDMMTANIAIDIVTMRDWLTERNKLAEIGGMEYLMSLVNAVPTAANIEHYLQIVATDAETRRVISTCTKLIGECYKPGMANAGDTFVMEALALRDKTRETATYHDFEDLVSDAWDDLSQPVDKKQGIPYAVDGVNKLLYGVEPGSELTLIAGRPSSGKTLILNQIAVNAAKAGKIAIYYSLETTGQRLVKRMIMSEAGVDPHKYRNVAGDTSTEMWDKVANATATIHNLKDKIVICDNINSLNQLIPAARRAILQYNAGVVLVDYLQIVNVDTRENRNAEVQAITNALKGLSQSTGVPVVAATQLNRPPQGTNHKPGLRDLREGGNQEAAADKVLIVHRVNDDDTMPRPIEFIIAKHKDGPIGTVPAWFTPGRFTQAEINHSEPAPPRNTRQPQSYTQWWTG